MIRLAIACVATLLTAFLLIAALAIYLRHGADKSLALILMVAACSAGVAWAKWSDALAAVDEELGA